MKKVYLSFGLLAAVATTNAQDAMSLQTFIPSEIDSKLDVNSPALTAVAGEDTLGLIDFSTSIQTTFDASGSGYIFGSSLMDTSITQGGQTIPLTIINSGLGRGFLVNDAYNVSGVMIWFGVKEGMNAAPADLNVSLTTMVENKAFTSSTSTAADGDGPGTQLATVALPFADVQGPTGTFVNRTFAFFSTPVYVNTDFAVVVDIEGLYGAEVDTVAIVNEANGTSNADGLYSWYRQAAQGLPVAPSWIASSALGLPADLAIFAIVQESGVGIEEQGYLNGVKMTTYPNPALSSDNVTIQYGLETAVKNVEINIMNLNGQVVYTAAEGAKASGVYNVNVPAGTLAAGSYIYAIQAGGARMAKKMEILK